MNDDTAAKPVFDISDFLTDAKAEVDGVWTNIGKGRELKLARAKNEEANKVMRLKYRANRVVLEQDDDVAVALNEELMIEVAARTLIRGVRVDGVEMAYDPADGEKWLQNRDFREKIFALANNIEAYRVKAEDSAVKS